MQRAETHRAKIIIAESNAELSEVFSSSLESHFHCALATSLQTLEALSVQADAVVLDVHLDGLELNRSRELCSFKPIVLTSRDPFFRAPGFTLLCKPFTIDELIGAVDRSLPREKRIKGFYVGCRVISKLTPEFGVGTIAEDLGDGVFAVNFEQAANGFPKHAKCHGDALKRAEN